MTDNTMDSSFKPKTSDNLQEKIREINDFFVKSEKNFVKSLPSVNF